MYNLIKNLNKVIYNKNNIYALYKFEPIYTKMLINLKKFPEIKSSNSENIYESNILYRTKEYDLIGFNWNKYSFINVKNEPTNSIYKIIKGKLLEERYDTDLNKIDEKILYTGDVSYINFLSNYKISNLEDKSISLHIQLNLDK